MKTPLLLYLLLLVPLLGMGSVPKEKPATAKTSSGVFVAASGMGISKEGFNLIIKYEVGGGASYYDRFLKRPAYVSENSGITIGIGYDLRFNSKAQIAADWDMLSPDVISRLQSVSGVKGTRSMARSLQSISIPYDVAMEVFKKRTIPRYAKDTMRSYPGVDKLHPHIQGAMLSWVFNRGGGISSTSSRDIEKRGMRSAIPAKPGLLAGLFRASKRIWIGKGVDGLIPRREDEARLCEAAL